MLLLEIPKLILFRIAFYKGYYPTATDLWQILDAKGLRMTGLTSHSTQTGAKRRHRATEQRVWNTQSSPGMTLQPHVPRRGYQCRSGVCHTWGSISRLLDSAAGCEALSEQAATECWWSRDP